ncbi:hypothetical protein [Micromonospora sp. SH-82]|uniref:hypothetical protein n=1 Tax=Micromonospora sp. SH-82 TaxID=3132938 RepID=UPI003EBA2441
MRGALEFLTTRVLRSRTGVAVVIAVLVFGVIATARVVTGTTEAGTGLTGRPVQPITTVDPTVGDDGVLSPMAPPEPVTSPGELPPTEAAKRFTAAWLGREGISADDWHADMRPLSTSALTEKLTDADPVTVPAGQITGEPTLRPRDETFVEVLVPLDAGQLRLELVAPDGRWLVDAVDWER